MGMAGEPGRWRIRIYRALLRLLPFEFRAEFGRDMEEAFTDERDDLARRRKPGEILRFWCRTLADIARTAPREQWDILRQDLRVGARLLVRSPGFAATAILTLALGIGGSTAIFSVVYAVVLRPLEFPHSERVIRIGWGSPDNPSRQMGEVSFAEYQAIRDNCRSFDLVGAATSDLLSSEHGPFNAQAPATPGSAQIGDGRTGPGSIGPLMASASLFKLYGVSAVLGRLPDERDEAPGATPVAVLSFHTWTSVYGRDPGVVGRTLTRQFGGGREKTVIIVGVLADGALAGVRRGQTEWPALSSLDPDAMRADDGLGHQQWGRNLGVYARLAPGVSLEAARAELASISPGLAPGLPRTDAYRKAQLRGERLRDLLVADVRAPLLAFLAAVVGLLLVSCVNVSSLVLARCVSRRHEFAARLALGARPIRVARQLLTESALLALSGGIAGVGIAVGVWHGFVAVSPSMPRLGDSRIGTPALLFSLGAMFLATCTSALVPALVSSRRSVIDHLRRAGGAAAAATGISRPLALLAATEVALVLVLLAGSGLLVNSFARLVTFDLGFDARSIAMVTIHHAPAAVPPQGVPRGERRDDIAVLSPHQREAAALGEEIQARIAAIPGVGAVGLTGDDPFGTPYRYSDARVADDAPPVWVDRRIASRSAFDALGLHLVEGRWFSADDREGMPTRAVVNQTMAQRLWKRSGVVGEQFIEGHRSRLVIGVVADVRAFGARKEAKPTFYLPTTQAYPDPVLLVVRKRPDANGVEIQVAAALAQMGARIEPGHVRPLNVVFWRQLGDARFLTLVVSVFGLLALAIALVGVHGVLRFSVVQRTRELGIRKALGAADAALIALVIGQALRFTLPACVLGLAAASLAAPGLRALLFGVSPTDPVTMVLATTLVIAAVVVAAYFPARRACAVDPSLSLRCD